MESLESVKSDYKHLLETEYYLERRLDELFAAKQDVSQGRLSHTLYELAETGYELAVSLHEQDIRKLIARGNRIEASFDDILPLLTNWEQDEFERWWPIAKRSLAEML